MAVHFKGSGFYNTDYGKQKRSGGGGSSTGRLVDVKPSESKQSDRRGEEEAGGHAYPD